VSQGSDDSKLDKVASGPDNDRDRASRLLGGESGLIAPSYNDIDFVVNQVGSELGKPINLAFRIAIFNDSVSSLHIAELVQTLTESLVTCSKNGWRVGSENPDPINLLLRMLRVGYDCNSKRYQQKQN
jgi:hypothetical protein